MKAKFRIKQIGDKFYPQIRKFLSWKNIYITTITLGCHYCSIFEEKAVLYFDTLDYAKNQFKNYLRDYVSPFKVGDHIIETCFCRENDTYYYVDRDSGLYSKSTANLCIDVQEYIDRQKSKSKITIHKFNMD